MIRYEITHFIHSTLRKNKLIHLIEALLEDSVMAKTLLEALCDQFKTFLSKEHSDIFEVDRLKYVIYLNEFKSRIAPLSPDKQIPETDLHLHLLELYEIPKKRNNLFAILLVYFAFSKWEFRKRNAIIVDLIYLYLLIITYRNGFGQEVRESVVDLDTLKLRSFGSIAQSFWVRITLKYQFLKSGTFKKWAVASLISFAFLGIWASGISSFVLRADVLSVQTPHVNMSKVVIDSLLLGRITDTLNGTIAEVGVQNILMITLAALLFQSLRTGFTNLFVNSFLARGFEFIGATLKGVSRLIFVLYNYGIYKVATRFLFASVHASVRAHVRPEPWILGVFLALYFSIYLLIIGLYTTLIFLIFIPATVSLWYGVLGVIILSIVLIFANLRMDTTNFGVFLFKVEDILKQLSKNPEKVAWSNESAVVANA